MSFYWLFLFCTIAYFIGNINFSIIISRFLKKDIRKMGGSGTAGAANMLRKFGFKWAIIVLILDMIKGIIPALIGFLVFKLTTDAAVADTALNGLGATGRGRIALYACGLASVVGHCFPVFFGFRGGKGVATAVGVFMVANPALAFIAFAAAMLYGAVFQYSSQSSIMFITAAALWEGFRGLEWMTNGAGANPTVYILLMIFYGLILLVHRHNIWRLLTGQENRALLFGSLKRKKDKVRQQQWLAELKQSDGV